MPHRRNYKKDKYYQKCIFLYLLISTKTVSVLDIIRSNATGINSVKASYSENLINYSLLITHITLLITQPQRKLVTLLVTAFYSAHLCHRCLSTTPKPPNPHITCFNCNTKESNNSWLSSRNSILTLKPQPSHTLPL